MLRNLDAETAIVGATLCENTLFDRVADIVKPDDFSEQILGMIYEHSLQEYSAGRSVNPVTLIPYFEDKLEALGGKQYLIELTNPVSFGMLDISESARQVADFAQRRKIQEGLSRAAGYCEDGNIAVADIISEADEAISLQAREGIHQPTGTDCIDEVIAGLADDQQGVVCRAIEPLDRVLGPLRPKQLVITAARPGMGKTAAALSYGLAAAQNGSGVLFVSLEMSSRELGQRMAADLCHYQKPVLFNNIRTGKLSAQELGCVHDARSTMADLPFNVVDAGYLTVGRLSSLIRRHARKMEAQGHKLELVIVDYLQLLSPDSKTRSPYEAISEVSRALKGMAKENNVSLMALAQLSREVEKRPDKRPQLSDLRDSGQIEQDADIVLFLLRNEYYLQQEEVGEMDPKRAEWEAAMQDCKNQIEFIVAKHRSSVTGSATGHFYGQYQAVRS